MNQPSTSTPAKRRPGGRTADVTRRDDIERIVRASERLGPEAVLKACFENYRIEKNLIIGHGAWPRGNFLVSSLEAAGLRPLENGISKDPRLCRAQGAGCRKVSPGVNAGTDGKDLGADVDAVDAALVGVE